MNKNCKFCRLVFALFFAFAVLPVIFLFASAFFENGVFENFRPDFYSIKLLLKSFLISSVVALLSTAIGAIISFFVNKINLPFRKTFNFALIIPLFVSPYIHAVAWNDLLFSFSGNLNHQYPALATMWVLIVYFTPLAVLITGSAFANIDFSLEESGLLITTLRKVILKITLPLIKPALLASFALVFIFSISEFSVPMYFGTKVFITEIFIKFSAFYNYSEAAVQSLLLVAVCIALVFAEKNYLANAPFFSLGTKGTQSKVYENSSLKFAGSVFVIFWFFLSVILPFGNLLVDAITGSKNFLYEAFALLATAIKTSFLLSFLGASLIVITGFAAAYFSVISTKRKESKYFALSLMFVFALPSIIYGIALIKFFNRPSFNLIYSSFALILIGYTGKFSFISFKIIENALKQIPRSITEAADLAGVSLKKQLVKIIFPLTSDALAVSFFVGFILSFGELGASIMLYPPGSELASIKVFTLMANAPQSKIVAMNFITLVATLFFAGTFLLLGKLFRSKNALRSD